MNTKIKAIFWDFDGTLVDTRMKNLQVTRTIYNKVCGLDPDRIPELFTVENYDRALRHTKNWRTFYRDILHLNQAQTEQAGSLWTEIQLTDKTAIPLFSGISDVVQSFAGYVQGIISQNSRAAIRHLIETEYISDYFGFIIGHEEVGFDQQKPAPRGLLMGLNNIHISGNGVVLFIGDHQTDVAFAKNTNQILRNENQNYKIVSIGALYGYDKELHTWQHQPDYAAYAVPDLYSIIAKIEEEYETQ